SGSQNQLKNFLTKNKTDGGLTYEKHGLYGHRDHIALSQIATNIVSEGDLKDFRLIYATLPTKILSKIDLPKTITLGNQTIPMSSQKITDPKLRINIFKTFVSKYKAAKKYKSQNLGQGKPLWLVTAVMLFEYYSEFRT